jgi:hypothetical protein
MVCLYSVIEYISKNFVTENWEFSAAEKNRYINPMKVILSNSELDLEVTAQTHTLSYKNT